MQEELNIAQEASFVLTVKNPEASSPDGAGLEPEQRAQFPAELQDRFEGRRFIPCDPPTFLDHEGCEIILIPTAQTLAVGLDGEAQDAVPHPHEGADAEPIFEEIRLSQDDRRARPLFEGRWA